MDVAWARQTFCLKDLSLLEEEKYEEDLILSLSEEEEYDEDVMWLNVLVLLESWLLLLGHWLLERWC